MTTRIVFGGAFMAVGAYLLFCGAFHVRYGRNFAGRWARGIFPRGRPSIAASWGPSDWRANGRRLIGIGVFFLFAGAVLVV
jgi:hypothetical protein